MRRGALLLGGVLAACGGGSGVDIDIFVPGDLALDRVELWVAYEECADCPNGVAWTQGERATGDINFLRDETVIKAVELGDRWVIHLDASDSYYGQPSWLAIAGFAADKVVAVKLMQDVRIPVSTVVTWQVYLHPAAPASTDLATPPADLALDHRAHVWARLPTNEVAEPAGCLAYQKWMVDTSTWSTEYFVPKSDPDCDGVPIEKECSEYWYQYKSIAACVNNVTSQVGTSCVVGLSSCTDGVTTDRTCLFDAAQMMCATDLVCVKCAGMIPADTCVAGAIDEGIDANSMLHFDCDFDATADGKPCFDQHVILQVPRANTSCSQPVMHYLDRPFTDAQTSLAFGSGADLVKFTVSQTSETCVFKLYWVGGTQVAFADGARFLLDVPYSNGKRLLYPIEVRPTNQTVTCGGATTPRACETGGPTATNDGMLHCAQ
jgi:hypothetical protein